MSSEKIDALIKQLDDKKGQVREKARLTLVDIGKEATIPLTELLTSKSQQARWEAAKALVSIADPTAIPALIVALNDKVFDIRWLAGEALVAIGPECLPQLLQALQNYTKEPFLLEGARHVIKYIIRDHPGDSELKESLKPLVSALEGTASRFETPGVAQTTLIKLKLRNK